jgi:RNA polymerase sigma-70 factor (ECF subfamily)
MKSKSIQAFLEGNQKAFEQLYNENYKLVFHIVHAKIKDYEATVDLCQDIFFNVYNSRSSYKNGNIKYWILSIASHMTSDWISKVIKKRIGEENLLNNESDDSEINAQYYEILDLASVKLDEKSYEIIIMHYCENMKFKEIAEYYNESVSTITNIASRAMKTLKEEIENAKD